jgi:hypothetical protein
LYPCFSLENGGGAISDELGISWADEVTATSEEDRTSMVTVLEKYAEVEDPYAGGAMAEIEATGTAEDEP